MNYAKTALLLAVMTSLFMGIGYLLGGSGGLVIAFLIAAGMNFYSYWRSDQVVLRMHNAMEVDERSAPEYYEIVRRLAEAADLPMPAVYVIDTPQPNAFATGRNPENAAVAASTGLLSNLKPEEIAGVMAHELAHIQNRDTLIMTITATFAGAISMLANFAMFFGGNRNNPLGFIGVIATMIVAPFAAMLVQMAISRTREYAADKRGAEICGNPEWLASALERIAGSARQIENDQAERNPATAHMFIINPLANTTRDNLFSTHPDTQNRVDALMSLAALWDTETASQTYAEAEIQQQNPNPSSRKNDGMIAVDGPWGKPSSRQQSKPAPSNQQEPKQVHPWGRRPKSGAEKNNPWK